MGLTPTTLRRVGLMAESFLPLLPRSTREGPGTSRVTAGLRLTVLAANLELGQRDASALARAIASVEADVLMLCEHSPATRAALSDAGVDERWPHRADDPSDGYFGSLVASRHPIVSASARDLGGRAGQVVDVSVSGATVRVVPVHTQAPIFDHDVAVWKATVAANAAVAASTDGPVVLAGDWNATGGHRAFRRALRRHDLVDASAVRGHRWFPTWPVDSLAIRVPLPPLLTLDHVVVRSDASVLDLERIDLPGTDHRALRATLRL